MGTHDRSLPRRPGRRLEFFPGPGSGWLATSLALVLAHLSACSSPPPSAGPVPQAANEPAESAPRIAAEQPPCTAPGEPAVDAYDMATGPSAGPMILPNGRALTPTGTQVRLGGVFPTNVISSHSGRYAFVGNGQGSKKSLQQIDLETGKVVATLQVKSLFQGLAISQDDTRLYAADGDTQVVYAVDVKSPGLTLAATWSVPGYPAGLALSPDGNRLMVTANLGFEVIELDPRDGTVRRAIETGRMPYQLVFSPDGGTLYVSLWAQKQVSVINVSTGAVLANLDTGKNPSSLVLSPAGDRLYVAASDSDEVLVFDTGTRRQIQRFPVGIFVEGLHGASPTALTLSPDGTALYVALAGDNAVEVYATADLSYLGSFPAGWYPSGMAITPDGRKLLVSNGKGEGAGPNPTGTEPDYLMFGTVSIIPVPLSSAQLAEGDLQVAANNSRALGLHEVSCAGKLFPIPAETGSTPIQHVVFILRENKTYDAYLGDLEIGNGDPDLVLWGEEFTPNTHQLAREFTLLDNFYTEAEDSDQGHMWTSASFVNDYKERTCHSDRPSDTGVLPASDSITRYVFDHLWANGVDYVNYGEVVGLGLATFKNIDLHYPGVFYNNNVKDQAKAEYVAERIAEGYMPSFTYMLLPNDHTKGTSPGEPTPESMISDNDYAVGLIVDAISKSEFWPSTVIFILEDDTQEGADHVDAHRSPAIVVSPWSRRGHVSSVLYSIPSIVRSFGLILGIPPLTQFDAMATPLYDAFTATPDFSTYDVLPRTIPDGVNSRDAFGAAESAKMNFSGVDRARGLGKLLWRYRKGTEPPAILGGYEDEDDD